jgi:hypothetical protein
VTIGASTIPPGLGLPHYEGRDSLKDL